MRIDLLPVEILQTIFSYCHGRDLGSCSQVCRFWRNVIEGLPDDAWRRMLLKDHKRSENEKDKIRSNLPWKELYKSRCLWTKTKSARIHFKKLKKRIFEFQILSNGTVGVLQNRKNTDKEGGYTKFGDTIVYYDLTTLKKINSEFIDFVCTNYKENDDLITLLLEDRTLCVIIKKTKEKHFIGKVNPQGHRFGDYTLLGTEVFFQMAIEDLICRSRLLEENGELTMKTEALEDLGSEVLLFSTSGNNVFVLAVDDQAFIYRWQDYESKIVSIFEVYSNNMIRELVKYGFDWSSQSLINRFLLTDQDWQGLIQFSDYKVSSVHRHGTTILLGTYDRKIHIYADAYQTGTLWLYQVEPDRTIDLNDFDQVEDRFDIRVKHLDVVEILNGHKIVAISNHKVFILDLVHNSDEVRDKKNRKRKKDVSAEIDVNNAAMDACSIVVE